MNPEAINSVIDNLASKLAVPAGKLMEVLPRLGYKTFTPCVMLAIGFCMGICLVVVGVYLVSGFENDSWCGFVIWGFGIMIICLILSVLFLPDYLFWRHDPEAWALDYMLNMLR